MALPIVQYAVYGALVGSNPDDYTPRAADVTQVLQNAINANNGIVTIDNKTFGDPAPNAVKHFGAFVTRGKNENVYFACREGQKINFLDLGGVTQRSSIQVLFAVYGAVPDTNIGFEEAQAADVTAVLQGLLTGPNDGFVEINNTSLGGDPAPNLTKHFAAVVRRNGQDYYFACQEGQGINFGFGGGPGH